MAANIVFINGRIASDLELKQTNNGKDVLSFNVAVRATEDKTDFIPVTAWSKTAEFISKYFNKGDGINITGRISTNTREGDDGKKHKSVEVMAREAGFPDGKKVAATAQAEAPVFTEVADEGGLPF